MACEKNNRSLLFSGSRKIQSFGSTVKRDTRQASFPTEMVGSWVGIILFPLNINDGFYFSRTPDRNFRCTHPYQPMGKIKKRTAARRPHAGRKSFHDATIMLKWRHHIACQRILDFLEVFFMFFLYNMRYLVVSKNKNLLFVWGWDRKIHPSWSPFAITRQALWCQSVILGTDFSIPLSHSWWILIISHRPTRTSPWES